ncbi:MAG: sodium ion-translocating decarboxylase subunit beta [Dysgonamonadaceae bacterium]|jgi:oxaloacetate decarboxylase beta subunit|nr:sodium ion-translocating decarboxylase subunit beta [Dysgonamonadaceae bacterium]
MIEHTNILDFLHQNLTTFLAFTGFANATIGNYIMICVGLIFLYIGVAKKLEPMLLVPIGFGILIGNIPFLPGTQVGIYEEGSLLYFLHFGLLKGIYPPMIFLGLGAMIDFSVVISNPKLVLIGIAAQLGIFAAYMLALALPDSIFVSGIGFSASDAGAIGIIGSADGPTSIFLASRLAPDLMNAIAISAYSYMALVPVIQPPIMRLLTSGKERVIKMPPARAVSQTEKIIFPIVGLLLTCFFVPAGLPLLGMLFFGNFLRECGVTKRLATTAGGPMTDILTILIGLTMGASTQADRFLTEKSIIIFGIGAVAFTVATATGILFVKLMNLFLKEGNKINPLIGNAGVSALPDSARVSQEMGQRYDKSNHLLMHAMGPTVASTIGSAVVAGIMLGFLG